VLAATGWLLSGGRGESLRRAGNHALLVAVAAALLPHGTKLCSTEPVRIPILLILVASSGAAKIAEAL
jgi:hypothetical protein